MSLAVQFLEFLSVLLLLIFGCESVRVKHSEFVKSWRVPDDSEADWPSPDQVYFGLGESIQGDVILPGGWDYRNGSIMKNWRFQSKLGAVVFPESTSDVQKAILFARDYGIRPTVYSSGHDFLGRSARDHTLSINMGRMREMEVNLNDSRSDTTMTMTLGTGRSWGEAYEEADRYGVIVLGGGDPNVSPGGYILGGGHSIITRMKGLGVDQVVAFTLVTANGSIVHMTEEVGIMENPDGTTEPVTDPDLWWAVLGGGGGVYGVVTQFVLKLHPAPDGFVGYLVRWKITGAGDECEGVATEALELFFDLLRTNLTNNWGGYIIPYKRVDRLGQLAFALNHWGRDEEEAMSVLEEFANFRMDCQDISSIEVLDTFWEYLQQIDDTVWHVWYRNHLIGTTLHEEDLVPGSGAAEMMIDIVNTTEIDNRLVGCIGNLIGGKARNLPQDATSVSPDFRNGLLSLGCPSIWFSPEDDELRITELLQYANNRMYQHGTGVYYNENDYCLQNWQVEYWGSIERYQRLLDVKQRWDPDNMFWCHHCVGSEFV